MTGATPNDTTMPWNFVAMLVTAGQSALEKTSRNDLIAELVAKKSLCDWTQEFSYRVVTRADCEEYIQTNSQHDVTPHALAQGFQQLIADDKISFLSSDNENQDKPESTCEYPTRVYLLVDYPASRAEAHALLITREVVDSQANKMRTSLIDGVLLILDPVRDFRARRKSLSQPPMGEERRRSSIGKHLTDDSTTEKSLPRAASASVFQTANPFVQDLYDAASNGGLEWSDFQFVDLPCCSAVSDSKTAIELVLDLTNVIETVTTQKRLFNDWVSSIKIVPLPVLEPTPVAALEFYNICLGSVFDMSITVATVVYAMREAITSVHAGSNDTSEGIEGVSSSNNDFIPYAFIPYGDITSQRLTGSYEQFITHCSHFELATDRPRCHPTLIDGHRLDEMENAMWQATDLIGVGNGGRKGFPRVSRSQVERSVEDTELGSFTTMPVPHVHLLQQLMRFEELLGPSSWKDRLHTREFIESLPHGILPQRLASIQRDNPMIFSEYHEPTDTLLLAMITATAPGRFRTTTWSAKDHVRHRPAIKDWKPASLVEGEYQTPRTALAATACMPLSVGELSGISEKCSIVYPADQSLVKLIQMPHAPAWLSISLHNDIFGLRPRPIDEERHKSSYAMHFYANFKDDSQLLIRNGPEMPNKPDHHGSITVIQTLANGLCITACSDGTITQRPSNRIDQEVYRRIYDKGTVASIQEDGSEIRMYPNGDVIMNGVMPHMMENTSELVVDPETNALMEKRENGVIIVTHTDGGRVTYHRDGTRMLTPSTQTHVLITKPGLADVCIDMNVQYTAQRHASGEKVAVTKGGLRTRSMIRAYDGTEMQLQYNTKVVAEVNGRIITRKKDGVMVIAKDSGRVEFLPAACSSQSMTPIDHDDDDRDVLHHNSVYYFDCRDGMFSLCDKEQNLFRVDIGDGRGYPTVSVQLAGALSEIDAQRYGVTPIPVKAVVNEPIEPHLFVLNGDGTGYEILRACDVQQYLNQITVQEVTKVGTSGGEWKTERVFLETLQTTNKEHREWFNDARLASELIRLERPTPLVVSHLPCFWTSTTSNQYSLVRHLQHVRSTDKNQLHHMQASVEKWRTWQQVREGNIERFKVNDPRSEDVISEATILQRRIVAAYKATRAKKKLERQREKEIPSETGATHRMETVQEQNDDENDEFLLLEDSDGDESVPDVDVEMEDLDKLMWTAYSGVDVEGTDRLTLSQARQALVEALGFGVTMSKLTALLVTYKQPQPFKISYDVFVDLVHAFRNEADMAVTVQSLKTHYNNNNQTEVKQSGNSIPDIPRIPTKEALKYFN